MTAAAGKLLKAGRNMMAAHCHQITGAQFIDDGIADAETGTGGKHK